MRISDWSSDVCSSDLMKLADMAMKVEASRLLIYRAAVNASQGLPSVFESSVGKCFANEMVREVTANGLQIMGGYGYSKEYRMEQRVRDSFAWGIAGGTTDVQKTNIAASLVGRRFNKRGRSEEHTSELQSLI